MNSKTLKLNIILSIILLNYSCSDKCNDSDLATNFPLKFKISSSQGLNQLSNTNFDVSLLKIYNSVYYNSFELEFSIQEFNEELIIESQIINTDTIVFQYDGIDRFELVIEDVHTEIVDCVIETLSFKAKASDDNLICDCSIDDLVFIEFNI